MSDLISRQAAIEAMRKAKDKSEAHWMLVRLPPAQLAQDLTKGCTDTISRAAVVDAIDGVDWYHQNQHGEMVHGANDDEHQAWYKADDIYKAIESVPPAQPSVSKTEIVGDVISRQAAIDIVYKPYTRDDAMNEIYKLPPVEPKRSKGKWQMVDYAWECDRCHCRQLKKKPTNFCPDCGALMEVELSYE